MTTRTAHTPTPWKVDETDISIRLYAVNDPAGLIASSLCNKTDWDGYKQTCRDFDYIVHCVNLHSELLEALKDATDMLHGSGNDEEICSEENLCQFCQLIAKAEGRKS